MKNSIPYITKKKFSVSLLRGLLIITGRDLVECTIARDKKTPVLRVAHIFRREYFFMITLRYFFTDAYIEMH